jgi:uncharacterized protein
MLLAYGLKNFLSFKEGVTVSFELDANCPESVAQGRTFSTLMCIKGANGSGKTQLLKGIAFLADFAVRSFAREPDEDVMIDPFFGDSQPSEFFAEFGIGSSVYRYELALTSKGVRQEVLYRTIAKRVKLFERLGDTMEYTTKAFSGLKSMRLRTNASIISIAHQYEIKELEPIHKFFRSFISNVGYDGLRERSFLSLNVVSEMFAKRPDFLSFAVEFIRECDIGIADIEIVETELPDERKRYSPVFLHSVEGKNVPVAAATESSGTKQLFRNLFAYKLALSSGGILALDEFDIYLHPHILPKLVNLFMDSEKNTKSAQLIFTTHNLEIIDISGRYRTILVNKDDNVSYAFRLDDVPGDLLRNDRSLIPSYREGRIGGVPRL